MILIAKTQYYINIGREDFKKGEVFKGWFDGSETIFLRNKRTHFSCHIDVLKKYFVIFNPDYLLTEYYDSHS